MAYGVPNQRIVNIQKVTVTSLLLDKGILILSIFCDLLRNSKSEWKAGVHSVGAKGLLCRTATK